MTQVIDDLPAMLGDALEAGDVVRPAQLLEVLSQESNALIAISDPVRAEPLFAAFSREFGFFPIRHVSEAPLALNQSETWSGLLRWIFKELAGWSVARDPNMRTLAAIFVAAQSVQGNHRIWASMPPGIAENSALLDCLKSVVKSAATEFGVRDGAAEPIWEREAVERFKVADAAGDWAEIGQSMRLFEHQLFRVGAALSQSVRLLIQCGLNHLVLAAASMRHSLVAMQVAHALPREASLAFAAASENPYVQFASVYHAVSRQGDNRPLSLQEQANLSATLLKVGCDPDRWTSWMTVFNTHPVRFPALQTALGETLAKVPEGALQAYINAVSLYPWQTGGHPCLGRQAVANCLQAFGAAAPTERRLVLWSLAYERWSSWGFGKDDPNQHLFAINWSDLDYAIVAFASECLDDTQRANELDKIRTALQDLDTQWFASITDLYTSWNRLLCHFQPFAHAVQGLSDSTDWLCETKTYLPFDPVSNPYLQAKFALQR